MPPSNAVSGAVTGNSTVGVEKIESTEVDLSENDVMFDRICEISDRLGLASD